MHYFSTLFSKERDMFRTDLLPIIRSLNTIFTATGICHASYIVWLLVCSILTSLADSQHNNSSIINTYCCEYNIKTPDDGQ